MKEGGGRSLRELGRWRRMRGNGVQRQLASGRGRVGASECGDSWTEGG